MKNKMSDVRDHLVMQLEALSDDSLSAEDMRLRIDRARASSTVAGTFIDAVKVEIDARARLEATNLPPALEHQPALALENGRK